MQTLHLQYWKGFRGDFTEKKNHIGAVLHSALVCCKILLCAAEPKNVEHKTELLELLKDSQKYHTNIALWAEDSQKCNTDLAWTQDSQKYATDLAWTLVSTSVRTRKNSNGKPYDPLAWHPNLKKEDGVTLRECAETRKKYMAADLAIMKAELQDKTDDKKKAMEESQKLDASLASAHEDFKKHCVDVISRITAKNSAAKHNNLIGANGAARGANTRATPNANVPPSSSAVPKLPATTTAAATTANNASPNLPEKKPNAVSTPNTDGTVRPPINTSTSASTNTPTQQAQPSATNTQKLLTSTLNTVTHHTIPESMFFAPRILPYELPGNSSPITASDTAAQHVANPRKLAQFPSSSSTTVTQTSALNQVVDEKPAQTLPINPTNGNR